MSLIEKLNEFTTEDLIKELQRRHLRAVNDSMSADLRVLAQTEEHLTDGALLSFGHLRVINLARCETDYHALDRWSPMEWGCAFAGEAGEACNAIKKLWRHDAARQADWRLHPKRDAEWAQLRQKLVVEIGYEIADTIIYADLLAARLGIHLGQVVREKFNLTSAKIGSDIRL